ncbi:MAG: endopeptidase La [Anaerolineales bacterium]|nr:endopeptidase La [Anaerolineales bacterium]
MSDYLLRWPAIPLEFNSSMSRRAENLNDVENTVSNDEGLIECAILPLRDVVLYPNLLTPLFVVHEPTILAIEHATKKNETVIALAQIEASIEDPSEQDLYRVGTEIAIGRIMTVPDGSTSILTQGRRRVEIVEIIPGEYLRAIARPIEEKFDEGTETLALMRAVTTLFEKCVQLNRSLPEEAFLYAVNIDNPSWLGDLVASSLNLTVAERQTVLEIFDPIARLQHISVLLGRELDVLELEDQIHSRVQTEVDRSQREMYLREQMKVIQDELGEGDIWAKDLSDLRRKLEHIALPEGALIRAQREIERLTQTPPLSPESGIIRTYLNWILELPWSEMTQDNLDVRNAAQILERDHYALKKAKDRILEYIAVRNLAPSTHKQPILCFVGPPGTGKTSIGRSIAEALGRKFARLSLGGVRDEAEIRGHRRTYIGALPGRILQTIHRAGSSNPLFMLDEVDKLGHDFRGDPAAALLEVLDPEQNHTFSDHYLEIPYDLSKVMFITTANTLHTIPPALVDRMEIIEFPGYIDEEKMIIARKFLIPRQLEQNGFPAKGISFTEAGLRKIIREYTWEAGVRNLEREIGNMLRKSARLKAEGRNHPRRITPSLVDKFLSPSLIHPMLPESEDQIGVATGLAWTENGGELMPVEVLLVDGKGNLQITGKVGDVMQESAQAALSYVKSRSKSLKIDPGIFEKTDIHIHIPEGAIPKDGPSAGITIATALTSALTRRPAKHNVGMSGEITLRGRILPIGGLREKIQAAYRIKLATLLIPERNEKDLVNIPKKCIQAIDIQLVSNMDEVLEIALVQSKPARKKPLKQ